MAKKKTVSLGDLHKMINQYKEMFRNAKDKTQAFDSEGNLKNVDAAKVEAAFKTLEAAEEAVGDVCEEFVLAIQVEEP